MNEPRYTRRGAFVFENRDGEVVRVTLGEPGDPESEFICMIHRSYIPDLISGFSQMCERKKK